MNSSKHYHWSLIMVMLLGTVIALTSCSKKDVVSDEPMMSGGGGGSGEFGGGSGGGEGGDVSSSSIGGGGTGSGQGLQTVYFDYDKYTIRSDARGSLKANASWLKSNPGATIQVEGHCDERGTIEYNLALGERRANAAKNYLVRMGIDSSRLSTISYGEERPSATGSEESAWSQNRRAEFVVLSK